MEYKEFRDFTVLCNLKVSAINEDGVDKVSATFNGEVNFNEDGDIVYIYRSINEGEFEIIDTDPETGEAPEGIQWEVNEEGNTVIYVEVAPVQATGEQQTVVYGVQINGGEIVEAVEAIIVDALETVVDSVEGINNTSTFVVTLEEAVVNAKFNVIFVEEEEEVEIEIISVEADEDNLVYTLVLEDLDGLKGTLIVNEFEYEFDYTEAGINAALANVKAKATDAKDDPSKEADLLEALKAPVLNAVNVIDEAVSFYAVDIDANKSVINSRARLQAAIDRGNLAYEEKLQEDAEAVQAIIDKVNNALNETTLFAALTELGIENLEANFIMSYFDEFEGKTMETKEQIQALVDEVNLAEVTKLVEEAEEELTLEAYNAVTEAYLGLLDEEVAEELQDRLDAVYEQMLVAALEAYAPTITVEQLEEGILEVTVEYPEVEDEDAAILVNDYLVDAQITVPAVFEGTAVNFAFSFLEEFDFYYTIPELDEDETTITFKLSEVDNNVIEENGDVIIPSELKTQSGVTFTVRVEVPFESATLAAGKYPITMESIAFIEEEGEVIEVRVIESQSAEAEVVVNPLITDAIAAIFEAENEEQLEEALDNLYEVDNSLDYSAEDINLAKYLVAFQAYTEEEKENATIQAIQATINEVNEEVELLLAALYIIDGAYSINTYGPSYSYDRDDFINDIEALKLINGVINKNGCLYAYAIVEAVEAQYGDEELVDVATAQELIDLIQTAIDTVNDSKLGRLNAVTVAADFEEALLALVEDGLDLSLYNLLTAENKLILATLFIRFEYESFECIEELQDFIDYMSMSLILGELTLI